MSSYILRLTKRILTGDEEVVILEKTSEDGYLWLLIIDLLIFIGLTIYAYTSSKKMEETNTSPDELRYKFMKSLIYANGIRALSMVIIITLGNLSGNNPTSWFNYIAHIVPSIIFVSAYMSLVTFLADLYYSNSNYQNHLAKPALLLAVISTYIILALIALITFASKAFKSFVYCSEFLIGIIYIILGSMLIYYGRKMATRFDDTPNTEVKYADYYTTNQFSETTVKLQILSSAIGGLFLLKSFLALLSAFHFFDDFYPVSLGANLWDFLSLLITEITPTLVFITVAKKKFTDAVEEAMSNRPSRLSNVNNDFYQPPKNIR